MVLFWFPLFRKQPFGHVTAQITPVSACATSKNENRSTEKCCSPKQIFFAVPIWLLALPTEIDNV